MSQKKKKTFNAISWQCGNLTVTLGNSSVKQEELQSTQLVKIKKFDTCFITIQHHNDSLAASLTDRPYAISVVINVLSL